MRRQIFNFIRRRRCTTSLEVKRTYASLSNSITLEADQVAGVLQEPRLLTNIESINLSTARTWRKYEEIRESDSPNQDEQKQRLKEELPRILEALDSASGVKKTFLSLKDVYDLPVRHVERETHENLGLKKKAPRTPITIFEALGLRCACSDLGLWTLNDFPTIEITDEPTRRTLSKAREFREDRGGGKASWHAFVADSHDPLFQAFDYVADFHSRDLTTSSDLDGKKTWVDLSPMGQGYYRLEGIDVDEFSDLFACDLERNVQYFAENEWRPGLYDEMRNAGAGMMTSVLQGVDTKEMTAIGVDRPIWQLSEGMRERLVQMLECADDEEVVFLERGLKKRKKA